MNSAVQYEGYLIVENEFYYFKYPQFKFLFHNLNDSDQPSGNGATIEDCKMQIDELLLYL